MVKYLILTLLVISIIYYVRNDGINVCVYIMPWNPEHYNVKPKIIHTKTFSCAEDHPIVWYTVDDNNKAMCEYCATHFVYEPKDKTYSEEMQDKIEPIDDSFVNKILKGSG